MGTAPSQFIQVRDLHPETSAEHIAHAFMRLPDVRIRRLLLVEGREAEHVPIAFVEFEDSNAAARVLALAAGLSGKGLLVKNKPARLSYIHVGVFVPVYGSVEPGVFKATNSTQLLAYWNADYRCSVFIPEDAIPEEESVEESRKRKDAAEHSKRKKSKMLGTGVTIKSGSGGMISHWSKRQDELNGAVNKPSVQTPTTFADLKIMACLLCSRKFKSPEELQQHESQSDLHRSNLANPVLLAKAEERIKTRNPLAVPVNDVVPEQQRQEQQQQEQQPDTGLEYRDRALERRIQIRQSGGTIEMPTSRHYKKDYRDAPSVEEVSHKVESKGSQLLSKMGYVSGGLGSAGQGRSEAIKAETYVPGVGLGSVGAKLSEQEADARREAGTYSAFVASVKENARSRYHREQ